MVCVLAWLLKLAYAEDGDAAWVGAAAPGGTSAATATMSLFAQLLLVLLLDSLRRCHRLVHSCRVSCILQLARNTCTKTPPPGLLPHTFCGLAWIANCCLLTTSTTTPHPLHQDLSLPLAINSSNSTRSINLLIGSPPHLSKPHSHHVAVTSRPSARHSICRRRCAACGAQICPCWQQRQQRRLVHHAKCSTQLLSPGPAAAAAAGVTISTHSPPNWLW